MAFPNEENVKEMRAVADEVGLTDLALRAYHCTSGGQRKELPTEAGIVPEHTGAADGVRR